MPKDNTVVENIEKTDAQNTEIKDNEDLDEEIGQEVTFDEIIKSEAYSKDYRKAVDREVSKAIKAYQTNHKTDVESLINQKVSEEVNKVKFQASLKENLMKAGVIDTTALIAHFDLKELEKTFDAEKESFKDLDKLINESKEKMPYLFKQEKQGTATGQVQSSFGGGKPTVNNLREALAQKYKK